MIPPSPSVDSRLNHVLPQEDFSSKKREILARLFPDGEPCKPSLIPLKVIELVYLHNENLLNQLVCQWIPVGDRSPEELATSCVNTVYALSMIFFGKEQSIRLIDQCLLEAQEIPFALPSPMTHITLSLVGLLDGVCMHRIPEGETAIPKSVLEKEFARLIPRFQRCMKSAKKKMPPFGDDEELLHCFERELEHLRLDFNSRVIDALKEEILERSEQANEERSFIYCVSIVDSSEECGEGDTSIEHVFFLEQFFCPSKRSVRFHLYQSWVKETTLSQEISRRGYKGSEGSYDWQELLQFLGHLKQLYSSFSSFDKEKMTSQRCFGYGEFEQGRAMTQYKQGKLTGISVRYRAFPIDPSHCLDNVVALQTALFN